MIVSYLENVLLVAVKEMKFQGNSKFNWNNDTAQSVAFYHQDALGSVALLSDWHGHTIEKFEYDVYGVYYAGKFDKSTPGQGQGCGIGWHSNPYGFTGKRFEAELGSYSFAFRDYSPRMMRWMTEDPVKDGENWYGYCGGDPVNLVDLWGLKITLPSDLKKWENESITNRTNCYNFALDYTVKEIDPGDLSGVKYNMGTVLKTKDTDTVKKAFIADAKTLNKTVVAVDETKPLLKTGEGEWMVAYGVSYGDIHWLRRNEDGTWYEKNKYGIIIKVQIGLDGKTPKEYLESYRGAKFGGYYIVKCNSK